MCERPAAQEEIFGPVLSVIAYDSDDEAIRIANDSKYGLHAAVIGTDLSRARRVASQLRAGRVVINGMLRVRPGMKVAATNAAMVAKSPTPTPAAR